MARKAFMAIAAAVAASAAGPVRADEQFQTVASAEGRFSVELPGKVQQASR